MPRSHFLPHHLFSRTTRAKITTSASSLPLELPPPPPPVAVYSPVHHRSLCFALAHCLIQRGLLSSARDVLRRIISHRSSSVQDAVSAVLCARARGMDLDSDGFGALVGKLVGCGEHGLAEQFFRDQVTHGGTYGDLSTLNYMITCYCRLGKIVEAVDLYNRIVDSDSFPSKPACYALVRELCAQELVPQAFGVFLGMCDAGMDMGTWIYNLLANKLCQKGHLDETYEVLSLMRERSWLMPTLHQYKALFCSLCNTGQTEKAELLSREMESLGFFIDKVMYTQLIKGYGMDGEMKKAMRVFYRMLNMGCEADNWTCTTIIHGFSRLGLCDKVCFMHNWMIDLGMEPCAATYHVIISSFCKEGNVDCALRILDTIWSQNIVPSVRSFTVLVAALYKEHKVKEADDLCIRMLNAGILPDHLFFFVTMRRQLRGCELELAFVMLQAIAIHGCQFDDPLVSDFGKFKSEGDLEKNIVYLLGQVAKKNFYLTGIAYDIFVGALCFGNNLDVALPLLKQMMSIGCQPVLCTYNSLIRCLCFKGHSEDAETFINLLHVEGPTPDLNTYLVTINELCKQGHVDSALNIFDGAVQRQLNPNVAIYDTIIASLGREMRISEAEDMFERMLQAGVDPDETVYTTMINAYAKSGRLVEARALFKRMVQRSIKPSTHTYSAIISGFVNNNMFKEACRYLEMMLKDGLEPNHVLYTSLIRNFLKRGEFEFAFKLHNLMDSNHIKRDLLTQISLLSGVFQHVKSKKRGRGVGKRVSERAKKTLLYLLQRKALGLGTSDVRAPSDSLSQGVERWALNLLRLSEEEMFMPNLYLYNAKIYGFCQVGEMEKAYEHYQLMQLDGLSPNQVTFTVLIGGYIMRRDIDRAISLFNMMNAEGCPPDAIACNTLLRGLCTLGRLSAALSVVFMMYKRGFIPSIASFKNLLFHFCEIEFIEACIENEMELIFLLMARLDNNSWPFSTPQRGDYRHYFIRAKGCSVLVQLSVRYDCFVYSIKAEEFDYKSLSRKLEIQVDKLILENERLQKECYDEVERVNTEAQNRISEVERSFTKALETERPKLQMEYMESIKELEEKLICNQQKHNREMASRGTSSLKRAMMLLRGCVVAEPVLQVALDADQTTRYPERGGFGDIYSRNFPSRENGNSQKSSIATLSEQVGLQKILTLLESEDANVRIHAVKGIANVSAEEVNQERIVEADGLSSLLDALRMKPFAE
ncbi:hypothetical protein MLD38_010910 [Melastoma candidum]|uniref:Uncharacterized protein n=1 Tax=Melastoma candidum TaxID=119954 RepID=A0ACB9R4F6_9MYRT|nr:hypothetical protein MLD38_010910 [Melastoma candidum]